MSGQDESWIKFLGTAGARFVVIKQLRASGGTWVKMGQTQILIDPGPGTLVRCASSRPRLDPGQLSGIVLTHRHLDHANDVNVMIEAMTDGGFKRRGVLLAPRDALEEDPVVLRYCRGFLEKVLILEEEGEYEIGEVRVQAPIRHQHGVETYGLYLRSQGLPTVAFVVDTRYFDGLCSAYAGADVLILNTVRYDRGRATPDEIQHLNLSDAERLISAVRPRVAVLTHFGMTMVRAKPWQLAEELSQRLGIQVVAASDGMRLDLTRVAGDD